MTNKKTAIHIMPSLEKDKEDYLIIFLDEKAYVKFQVGEDAENTKVTGFCAKSHSGNTIANIIIELVDGKPVTVRTVEK